MEDRTEKLKSQKMYTITQHSKLNGLSLAKHLGILKKKKDTFEWEIQWTVIDKKTRRNISWIQGEKRTKRQKRQNHVRNERIMKYPRGK